MLLQPVWLVAFSGHRPNSEIGRSAAELQACGDRIRQALAEFQRTAKALEGDIEFYSSAAEGADQIAIAAAESMGIAIHIILPLPITEFAEDFRGRPLAWDLTLASIAKAGGLIGHDEAALASLCALGERKTRTAEWPPMPVPGWTFRVAVGTHERDDCYHDCGIQMLEAADGLIAVWNRDSKGGLGGTFDVINQAKACGIAIAVVDAADRPSTAIEWNAKPWQADPIVLEMNSANGGSTQKGQLAQPIQNVFSTLDDIANRTGGRLKNRVSTIIAFQFSATILAAINSSLLLPKLRSDYRGLVFEWDAVLIGYQVLFGCELILVVTAFLLGVSSRWTNLKSIWRQTRFAAEVLRSLIHTRGLVDPLYPIVSRHNPIWHRFALSGGLLTIRDYDLQAVNWEAVKADYFRHRIEHQRESYYQKHLVGASRLSTVCGKVALLAGTLAPICLLFALYLKLAHQSWISSSVWSPFFITFLPILLPLLAGTSTSLKVVTDAGRRAERYAVQANRLLSISKSFLGLKTPSAIRRAVVLTEEILLDELIEWHAASKNTGK